MTLFERARRTIPGGVSSPARAFGAVGGEPLFGVGGDGAYVVDADGVRYLDYIQGFGSVILGHAAPEVTEAVRRAADRGATLGLSSPDEVRLAELVCERMASVERVRFVASGTEAGMTAARIARAATGRRVLVKFEGCYHGHADPFLAKAGSGVATFAVPMAAGVPPTAVGDTIVLPYDDPTALRTAFEEHGSEIAGVFVEPVAANMGVVVPRRAFLESILRLCREHGAVSVFDEVVTGFRFAPGGVQGAFGMASDLTMLGKVLGGGLPIGAVGGRAELMDLLVPVGSVYQAGTYAAHPHAMAAGVAVLEALDPERYPWLEATAARLASGLVDAARQAEVKLSVVRAATFLGLHFTASVPRDFAGVQGADLDAFAPFHRALRDEQVLLPPSPYEAWFPSFAHTDDDIDRTVEVAAAALWKR